MATENTEKKPSQEELLKAVADVLDEAMAIYESEMPKLAKGAERPIVSSKMDEGLDSKMEMQGALSVSAKPVSSPGIGDGSTTGIMAKDEDKGKDKDKKDKEDMEKTDAELISMYKSLVSKMESRGLIRKSEPTSAPIQKSENVPAAPASYDDAALRKSIDERFESITGTLQNVAETVKKIAAQPKDRKGLTGYQPLKKSEGQASLKKSEVVGKLLDLKKSGDPRVAGLAGSLFITRVEQGRLMKGDDETLKALGILGE
jgi:hypothetical protein